MNIGEFLDLYETGKDDALRAINVQDYIPFELKEGFIEGLTEQLINEDEDGVKSVNSLQEYFLFTIGALQIYTDLEFNNESDSFVMAEYDELVKTGALNSILEIFEADYRVLYEFFKQRLNDKMKYANSFELELYKVAHTFSKMISLEADNIDEDKIAKIAQAMRAGLGSKVEDVV